MSLLHLPCFACGHLYADHSLDDLAACMESIAYETVGRYLSPVPDLPSEEQR